MSKKLVRLNDASDHGGTMITATAHFSINGIAGCVSGDIHHCPRTGHGNTPVTATTSKLKSGSKALIRVGDLAGCGAIITAGSGNVDSE